MDATSYDDATERVLTWARRKESRYVCLANVHMVMEARDDPAFRAVVNGADLVTPDGMPLAWMLRRQGVRGQDRVCGPDLMPAICAAAAAEGVGVGFFGGRSEVLDRLVARVRERFPGLEIPYAWSPPFRELSSEEDEREVRRINDSGAGILFVGLGCPKQEWWMARHRGRVRAVMLGVGAAFDFHAGTVRRAPRWMREAGLEWVHRLVQEPRRLWRRYLRHNLRFAALAAAQLMSGGIRD
ncbi:WecB/TagA/CpsF family glycosyltransferase [Inmirania thermothiophila]|uniref:WecB/TagA/CpsF family glycosyltransferase n=1 Tax=Inmirania thermothiophila TaxID=1750597 RepID=UPI001FE83BCD|nr:WecB/TagA/CpsF family glycosyltransferase [Inmirania thermothiophila]